MLTIMVSDSDSDLLHLDVDLRIGLDMWSHLWREIRLSRRKNDLLCAVLRAAYGAGYMDALTEPRRGQLLKDHGITVPRRHSGTHP
jgi:hypothetical protein